jgi:hypothetical protein
VFIGQKKETRRRHDPLPLRASAPLQPKLGGRCRVAVVRGAGSQHPISEIMRSVGLQKSRIYQFDSADATALTAKEKPFKQ